MKIFSTSDIHGRYKGLRKIVDFLNSRGDIDAAIFCGDIAEDYNYSTVRELSRLQAEDYLCFKTMISEIVNKKVYYILGNHDVFLVDKEDMNYLPNAVNANIEHTFIPFEIVNIQFYGINREGNEVDIKKELNDICSINKNKIIISHAPPYKCLDKSISGRCYGSSSIRNMILDKSPLMFICGHVHEGYGVEKLGNTLVVNCSCSNFEIRGVIIDTHLEKYEEITLWTIY